MRRPLRAIALLPVLLLALTRATPAHADDAGGVPADLGRLRLDTGRGAAEVPDPDALRFVIHGEEQLRFQAQRTFPMVPTASRIASRPGLAEDSHGQNAFLSHWLRVTPRLLLRDRVELVAQADLVTGVLLGDEAHDTSADASPRDALNGFYNVQPRWLYVTFDVPFGVMRIGQQPNHWGMGLLWNDGDHPTLFGDYRYGSISDRIAIEARPGGAGSGVVLGLAGDLVFRDPYARLVRGEQAIQGVASAAYERGPSRIGLFGTLRRQENDGTGGTALFPATGRLAALTLDLHGRLAARVPGEEAFVYGEAEIAMVWGASVAARSPEAPEDTKAIRAYGGAAVVGFVHRAWDVPFQRDGASAPGAASGDARGERGVVAASAPRGPSPSRGVPYGDLVAQIEVGHASGDDDPRDATQGRFTFDPNHRIGLLLFDEVLRFQTARSATAALDPQATGTGQPTRGLDQLPTNGGVAGAQYVNPTVVVRPAHWLDLKGGLVVAQATTDVVDPYRVGTTGASANYRGGNRASRDLGLEVDAGFEARIPLEYGLLAQVGAQAGLLLPGRALANDLGEGLPPQWVAIGRLGLLF
jgi:hypothetical protein